jgi:collagenase-like PrtC family protease
VLSEARELVGAEALPVLASRVGAVRLDIAHQPPQAVEEIARAYRAAFDALQAEDEPAPRAAPEDLIVLAGAAHRRHAPRGEFAGRLFHGSRRLDDPGPAPKALNDKFSRR